MYTRNTAATLMLLAGLAIGAASAEAQQAKPSPKPKAQAQKGKKPAAKDTASAGGAAVPFGFIQVDLSAESMKNGSFELGSVRLGLTGESGRLHYKVDMEASGEPVVHNAFLEVRGRSASIRAGSFRAAFNREGEADDDAILFESRSLGTEALSPGRQIGAQIRKNLAGRMELSLGAYNGETSPASNDDGLFLYGASAVIIVTKDAQVTGFATSRTGQMTAGAEARLVNGVMTVEGGYIGRQNRDGATRVADPASSEVTVSWRLTGKTTLLFRYDRYSADRGSWQTGVHAGISFEPSSHMRVLFEGVQPPAGAPAISVIRLQARF